MRVLVTGATGFLGSHVAASLVTAGHEVVVTLRASSDARWLAGLDVDRISLDLAAPARLPAALEGIDAIVHAAGITRAAREEEYQRINVDGTRALLVLADAAGVERFVLISSLAARGPDDGVGPTDAYGRSKLAAEVAAAESSMAARVVALRVGGVYGPRDTDLLPLFRLARAGVLPVPKRAGPLQPVFVHDVASLVSRVIAEPVGFGPWPVAAPWTHRWEQLPRLLASAVGRDVRPVPMPAGIFIAAAVGGTWIARMRARAPAFDLRRARDIAARSYTCDVDQTEAAIGWRACVDLPTGLITTAQWYREQGWLRPATSGPR